MGFYLNKTKNIKMTATLEEAEKTFIKFMKYGDSKATAMTGKNFSKLCKDCKILGWKKITQTDIDMEFAKKIKKGSKMSFKDFQLVVGALASKKQCEPDVLYEKIINKEPITAGTKVSKTGNVAKMTDTSKYTGSHKERFDQSGKGKGIDGRVNKSDNSGYVGNYKGEGTYDKK